MLKRIALLAVLFLVIAVAVLELQPSLKTIHQEIIINYQGVVHLNAQEFTQLDQSQTIVFDVREEGEFKVSHLANAVWVPPDLDAEEFIEDYGDLIDGKQAVFYCSVGRRSSEFVQRVQAQAADLKLSNLEGGLFSWVNQEREFVGDGVHPYNAYWGRLIKDKNKIKYQVSGVEQ